MAYQVKVRSPIQGPNWPDRFNVICPASFSFLETSGASGALGRTQVTPATPRFDAGRIADHAQEEEDLGPSRHGREGHLSHVRHTWRSSAKLLYNAAFFEQVPMSKLGSSKRNLRRCTSTWCIAHPPASPAMLHSDVLYDQGDEKSTIPGARALPVDMRKRGFD